MENFVCLNCRYRFKSNGNPKTCPWCNRDSVEKESSAEDIVNEVEKLI